MRNFLVQSSLGFLKPVMPSAPGPSGDPFPLVLPCRREMLRGNRVCRNLCCLPFKALCSM